jgi:hypothetical protein
MVPEVIGREGLFDHEQAEAVEGFEGFHVFEAAGAFGLGLEHDAGEPLAHSGAGSDIPARLDLDLDPFLDFV